MKRLMSQCNRFLFFMGTGMALTMLIFSGIVFGQDNASPPFMDPSRILSADQREVTILKKTPESILAGETRFIVTPTTVIEMGEISISFRDMPVPCTAIVYCEKRKNQDLRLLKIEVREIASNAGSDWSPAMPE